jgi:DNA-binding transcriptional LysR family regulator
LAQDLYRLGIELRQLRYLVALADERHFTRAALRVQIAQPALSRQIRNLEAELGVALVHRTTRRVALTDAGTRLVERARRVLAEVDAAQSELQNMAGLVAGRVAMGVTATPGPVDIPKLLGSFYARYPGVELAVREELSTALTELLRADALDFAFITAIDGAAQSGLEMVPRAFDELVVALAPHHPLADRDILSVADLRTERFVSFRRGATIRRRVERAAAAAGFEPRIPFESNEVGRTRAIVSQGLAIAVLPLSDTMRPGPPVRTVPLSDPAMTHEIFLAWRAGRRHSPAAQAMLAMAQDG